MSIEVFTEEERVRKNREAWEKLKHSTLFRDADPENPRYFVARHKVDAETWEVVELDGNARYSITEFGTIQIHAKLDFGELFFIQILLP